MLENPKRYTITAALPYTNGPIHIGHLAGVYVPSDIYARYLRLQGKDVAFMCGSDEHGVAISMKAKKEGISPQEVIDKYDGIIRKSFLITTQELLLKFITTQHKNSLKNYTIKVISSKKLPSNYTMQKQISF